MKASPAGRERERGEKKEGGREGEGEGGYKTMHFAAGVCSRLFCTTVFLSALTHLT